VKLLILAAVYYLFGEDQSKQPRKFFEIIYIEHMASTIGMTSRSEASELKLP
jgi:hypothetical protein